MKTLLKSSPDMLELGIANSWRVIRECFDKDVNEKVALSLINLYINIEKIESAKLFKFEYYHLNILVKYIKNHKNHLENNSKEKIKDLINILIQIEDQCDNTQLSLEKRTYIIELCHNT